ncbi:MAG TPA: acyl-CoA thioesterase, partial [Gammaproteobacteria bacterium]|nr:acyl-CoA thioesterase [Gammaproteobacteria bacterium]
MDYRFTLDFKVRDYECDMQGVVNNSVYLNYLEHTRHEFLLEAGIDFAALTRQGIHLVVTRTEIDYRYPLRAGDRFRVGLNVERSSRIRFTFKQDIFRLPDDKPVVNAMVTGTAMNDRGRPIMPDELMT